MKHQQYAKKKASLLRRIAKYFNSGCWVVVNAKYTKRFPRMAKDIFALRSDERI